MTTPPLEPVQIKYKKKVDMAREEIRLANEYLDSLVESCNHVVNPSDGICIICGTHQPQQ